MDANYYAGINNLLLDQVPLTAEKIFEVGCGYGNLGEQIKKRNPKVTYYAMEVVPEAAKIAATKLDHVFCGSIESSMLVDDQFDCIIFGDVLEHLYDPLSVLRNIRSMLKPDGCVLCSIPNIQHHTVLESLLAGDFQYQDSGILDRTHIRFFTYSSFIKLMLDSGFKPWIADINAHKPQSEFFESLKGALDYIKQDADRAFLHMSVRQYIFKAAINTEYDPNAVPCFPISFIVPTNNYRTLSDNFLSSPIFKGSHPHQLIILENQSTAADAIENGIKLADHDFVVYAHQDVYLPHKWDAIFSRNVEKAQRAINNAALFGVFGALMVEEPHTGGGGKHHGQVISSQTFHNCGEEYPMPVDSVDELLIGFSKKGFPGADPLLGYHLYATDIACSYKKSGGATVVVNALCYHNCRSGSVLPKEFCEMIPYLKAKWSDCLPLATCCTVLLK